MMLFPHKVGEYVDGTTFLAIAEIADVNPKEAVNQVIMSISDMSGYNVFCWDTSDGSVYNREYHNSSEKAGRDFLYRSFNVII